MRLFKGLAQRGVRVRDTGANHKTGPDPAAADPEGYFDHCEAMRNIFRRYAKRQFQSIWIQIRRDLVLSSPTCVVQVGN